MQKEELGALYPGSENIYFTIVCKLNVEVPPIKGVLASDLHEHYRFVYSRQQVPIATYQPTQIETIPYLYLILLLVSLALVFLLCTYLFTKKIVPIIARLRNSNLVEEEPPIDPRDDLEVPASSDRNQRAPDVAVETEEKMAR